MGSMKIALPGNDRTIKNWKQFARQIRRQRAPLLSTLDEFENVILVAGCQRSGTTMLTRVLTRSEGIIDCSFGHDDELDAALILSGRAARPVNGRCCFQTTYLNECYEEYYQHPGKFRLIWVLRNPFSTIYSLVHHWKRFALNELFEGCGVKEMNESESARYRRLGRLSISPLLRACLSYNAKVSQVFELRKHLNSDVLAIVDYDNLVKNKEKVLPEIYDFVGLEYSGRYGDAISTKSLNKSSRLSTHEQSVINERCLPVYHNALKTVTI